jgi:small conductance mechanosensitive channel
MVFYRLLPPLPRDRLKELDVPKQTQRYAFAALLCTCLCVYGPIGHAQVPRGPVAEQQADLPDQDKLLVAGKEVTAESQQLNSELAELKKAYSDAKGGEQRVLLAQIRAKREALIKSLEQLIGYTKKLEDAGQDSTRTRNLSRKLMTSLSADLERSIEQAQQRVTELGEQRSSASPEEREALDKRIEERATAVDQDLAAYFKLTQLMEAQGGNPSTWFEFLDGHVKLRVETLSGTLRFLVQDRASIGTPAPGASDEEKKAQAAKLAAVNRHIKEAAAHLHAMVVIMKERGLDTAAYTQLLIQSTGELTEGIFQTRVALRLMQGWLENTRGWLIQNGPRGIFKFIVFMVILVAFKVLAGIVKRLVLKAVTASKLDLSYLLRDQIVFFSGKVVIFLGLLVALSQLGIQLGPVLAGLGIAGFTVGFALQNTLSNFAAGLMILVYRPYDVGDAVEAAGVMGTVKAMNLVSTTITTWDNQRLMVPNGKIWGDVIRNITAEPTRRVDMTFGIAYADDIDHAERVLWDIIKSNELVLQDPEPVIRLHTLGESSVDFIVRPWVRTSDYWTVYWDTTRAVKKRFDEENISIPFPQRDVHLIREKAAT